MKISAYHKNRGDSVEWWNGLKHYDLVYKSKVFTELYSADIEYCINAEKIIGGGTGYDLKNKLQYEVEHTYPDYSLYGVKEKAIGHLTRGCPRNCPFCIVSEKEGNVHTVAELSEFWEGQKEIVLMDSNITASKDCEKHFDVLIESKALINFEGGLDIRFLTDKGADQLNRMRTSMIHFAWDNYEDAPEILPRLKMFREVWERHYKWDEHGKIVYTLVNFNTTHEQDLDRIYKLRELGFWAYVMVYDKQHCQDRFYKRLQRWVNNRRLFAACKRYEDYNEALEK